MGIVAVEESEGSRKRDAGSNPGWGQEWRLSGTGCGEEDKVQASGSGYRIGKR